MYMWLPFQSVETLIEEEETPHMIKAGSQYNIGLCIVYYTIIKAYQHCLL